MAVEIPTDAIKQLQISLRKEAKMSSYDPDDTPLANLPSPEETISEVDPSPPYLRCKHCKGRLLRGVASLICVFCGRETCEDLPPDPINFRNTFGYQWLLKSLALNGSVRFLILYISVWLMMKIRNNGTLVQEKLSKKRNLNYLFVFLKLSD